LHQEAKFRAEQKALSRWYFDIHVQNEREIASKAEILTTLQGRKVAWMDIRAWREHLNVAGLAVEMHDADVAATVILGGVLLGGQSIDQGLDLSFLHGEHMLGLR